MPKSKFVLKENVKYNNDEFFYLMKKYYTLYMNSVRCNEIPDEDLRFMLNCFWEYGRCAAYNIPVISDVSFAPFAEASKLNKNGQPVAVNLVDLYGVGRKIIPYGLMTVNKDVVLMYALECRLPIRRMVEYQVRKICDVRKAIKMNLKTNMIPYFIKNNATNDKRLENIIQSIQNGDSYALIAPEDATSFDNATLLNPPYLIDKLQTYQTQLENELLTFLGINNIGVQEKKERMITDEVESNNELIAIWSECWKANLEKASKKIKEVLGHELEFYDPTPIEVEEKEENQNVEAN